MCKKVNSNGGAVWEAFRSAVESGTRAGRPWGPAALPSPPPPPPRRTRITRARHGGKGTGG